MVMMSSESVTARVCIFTGTEGCDSGDNSTMPRRSPILRSMPRRSIALHKSPGDFEALFHFFGRQIPIRRRQKPGIRALLDGHQVHVFEFARVGVRPNLREYIAKDFAHRRTWFRRQLMKPQGPNEYAFYFIAAEHQPRRKRRYI